MSRSRKRLRKKGLMEVVLQPAFVTVLVLGLVLISLLAAITRLGSNTFYAKEFESRNVALIIESIHAAPDNVFIAHGLPKGVRVQVGLGNVTAYNSTVRDPERSIYTFVPDTRLSYGSANLESADALAVIKTKTSVEVRKLGEYTPNFHAFDCVRSSAPLGRVRLDVGLSDGARQERAFRVASAISGDEFISPRTAQPVRPLSVQEGESVISIGFSGASGSYVKAFYNVDGAKAQASRSLACHILNEISGQFPGAFSGFSLVPLDPGQLGEGDDRTVLRGDHLGAYLELGSTVGTVSVDPSQLGARIQRGVESYG